MAKAVKLADIARALGVSTVTVSKALSGQKGVSEEMREKIVKLADQLGYKSKQDKKKEEAVRGYTIGVLIHEKYLDEHDSFYLKLYQMVAMAAVARSCFTLLEVFSTESEAGMEYPQMMQERKVDGMLIIGRLQEDYLAMLEKSKVIPVIYLDFCDQNYDKDAVISDSFYGGYYLTNYLFSMGHRRIAYLGTVGATDSITDRYFGYMKAMLEHGLSLHEDWKIDDRDLKTGIMYESHGDWIPGDMPTAYVCNCDLSASFLIKQLEENGYRVPEDISVVGYDNFLFPGLCDVALTTYEVDIKGMANEAVQTMIKKMSGEPYRPGIRIVEGHMVIKDSVKKIE